MPAHVVKKLCEADKFHFEFFFKPVFVLDEPSFPAHKNIDIGCYGFHLACGESCQKVQMKDASPRGEKKEGRAA